MVTPLKITLALALSWFVLVGAASAQTLCTPDKVTGSILGMMIQNNPTAMMSDIPEEALEGFTQRFNAIPPQTEVEISSVYYFKKPELTPYYVVVDFQGCALFNGIIDGAVFLHLKDGTPFPNKTNTYPTYQELLQRGLREANASNPQSHS